ncbi:hypothetical protein [Nocardiopsis metallicus]|uniref:Uncharacterized protein n=1 Tax=Nocardiopsis metallicus TaxID=179819 RepID=A0A840WCE3_9ACTN|nr:hypothetical protein [Nocardiopsis metallicus]MBB5490691.1 hypothetical protein [Nocardiopsis metallicus]
MNDVHIPKPILPQEWDKIDTSVDNEDPQILSSEQFARYCVTIRDLLRAAGLSVQDFDKETPDFLIVDDDDLSMKVQLASDRLANIEITLGEEMAEAFNTVQIASRLVRLFELGRGFRDASTGID